MQGAIFAQPTARVKQSIGSSREGSPDEMRSCLERNLIDPPRGEKALDVCRHDRGRIGPSTLLKVPHGSEQKGLGNLLGAQLDRRNLLP